MSVRYYDEAIVNKIQKWIKDPNMHVLKPNQVSRLWETRADEKNDEPLTLPLVAISRDPSVSLKVSTKRNLSCDGLKLDGTKLRTLQLNAIPIQISYNIDIYTQRYDEGDEYLRNFIFNIVNHPKMKISIPYNDVNIEHVCTLLLDNTVTDNSDVSEKLFADQFTRWTLHVSVESAYLFSVPVQENAQVVGAALDLVDEDIPYEDYEGVDLKQQ